ncbi:MAG TPA: hypothetical protein VG269_16135 [Tepidisphaeraceae bacterium]|jgi:WD40 repeat protein|nr:hypothetical protein [Tepidisphaeraceae bacterium]
MALGKPLAKSMCHRNTQANYARFSHDGKRVVICADSGGNGVWDVATGKKIMTIRGGPAYAAAFSPDDTHVTVAGSNPETDAELTTVWKIEPDEP